MMYLLVPPVPLNKTLIRRSMTMLYHVEPLSMIRTIKVLVSKYPGLFNLTAPKDALVQNVNVTVLAAQQEYRIPFGTVRTFQVRISKIRIN